MAARNQATEALRADLGWHNGPTLYLQAPDGNWHRHTLTPAETCALIKRLAGHIQTLHQPAHDRTNDTLQANPELDHGDDT